MLRAVNWPKRLAKFDDNRFQPGEELVATAVFQVRGAVRAGAVSGGWADRTPALVRRGEVTSDGRYNAEGMVRRLPVKPLLFGLTDADRVLVYAFELVSLKLTYATTYRAADIDRIELGGGVFARHARITFADGSSVSVDAPRLHAHADLCRRLSGN